MRAVVQRVERARVSVDHRMVAEIAQGLAVLVGVAVDDGERDAEVLASKLVNLRIFRDADGLMNRSVAEEGGGLLLVSQFTLLGDARKGRRPSFIDAAGGETAERLYRRVGELVEREGVATAYGEFGADMRVELVNDGPVTILLDTKRTF